MSAHDFLLGKQLYYETTEADAEQTPLVDDDDDDDDEGQPGHTHTQAQRTLLWASKSEPKGVS